MSVSGELLCSFELLKPLDSSALKSHIKKSRNKRNSALNSPVSLPLCSCQEQETSLNSIVACYCISAELLAIYLPSTLASSSLQPRHDDIMRDLTKV